jgi:butyryl-CoA dehydrogenase
MFINQRDLEFLLYEWLDVTALCQYPRYSHHDRETFDAVLETARSLAEVKFAPHAAKLDVNEPVFNGTHVQIIPEVAEALQAYCDCGFMAAGFDLEWGGMQLPATIVQSCSAMFKGANSSTAAYPMLAVSAGNLLAKFASDEQKNRYLRPIIEGRFFGTMCLSESQAGSSLADITTVAVPTGQDFHLIRGSKMWISAGAHELSENIVHLVLARIPGGPPGVKGISLFIVPRYQVAADGSLGAMNDVRIAGLNHKMGARGTSNALLSFGEDGNCQGYLVGEPHRGLTYMFHMMNEARIGVGLSATMLGYSGYLHALKYARERSQGRHPGDRDPSKPQVAIIEHADIKRLLLSQKAYVEGALALILFCSRLVDEYRAVEDEQRRRNVKLLLDLLTPVAKSWPSEFCLEANKLAIQVLGGYGYTRDYPLERLYRDNRLNSIHEGTQGIQAIDLLGRKVRMQDGAALQLLTNRIMDTVARVAGIKGMLEWSRNLSQAVAQMQEVTKVILAERDLELSLANATIYLDTMGHLVVAWLWLQQAIVADENMANASEDNRAFYQGKLQACRFFFRYELPKVTTQASLLKRLDDTCLKMPDVSF